DPVTDILTIETQSSYYKELKIYDLVGTKISSAKILNDKISIDLTTFLPGVYFLNLGNEIKMFIKE
ncbi:MAG: T9SS type A sorting domain-containing protein, partial [FCB group bacterium]